MYDVCIVGLGSHGSAIAHRCAELGLKVIGFDLHTPPHIHGSHNGDTRITRLIQFEGEHLLPLVKAGNAWRNSFSKENEKLFVKAGFLTISQKNNSKYFNLDEQEAWALRHDIKYQRYDTKALRQTFPAYNISDQEEGFLEPEAGYLDAPKCIEKNLVLAKSYGAELHYNTEIKTVLANSVVTTEGKAVKANKIILCAGALMGNLVGAAISKNLKATKQGIGWFGVTKNVKLHRIPHAAPFVWERANGHMFYGFPSIPDFEENSEMPLLKIGIHSLLNQSQDEWPELFNEVQNLFPDITANALKKETCLYTMTPDEEFIVDRHPQMSDVWICSACSGHGFKMSFGLGIMFGDIMTKGHSDLLTPHFKLSRFW